MFKVGIIGAGFMGEMHAQCYKALPDKCELKAIADLRSEKARLFEEKFQVKTYSQAEELIGRKDIDIIDVCLPTYLHKEYVLKAIKAGKNVLCEKPIALTIKEGEEMVQAAKEAGVKFMIAQVIRFWPEYVYLKELYDRKELGKLKSFVMTRLSPRPVWGWENWLQQPLKSGGALVDLHIHDTDYCLYFLDWPKKISSRGNKTKFGWDHVFSTFTYRGGVVASLEGGWDMPDKFPFTMAFTANFEKGTVEYNSRHNIFNIYKTTGETESPKLGVEMEAKGTGGNISSLGGYVKEIEYFLNYCLGQDVPKIITPEEAVESLRLVLEEMKLADRRR